MPIKNFLKQTNDRKPNRTIKVISTRNYGYWLQIDIFSDRNKSLSR